MERLLRKNEDHCFTFIDKLQREVRDRDFSYIWEYTIRVQCILLDLPESGEGKVVDFYGSVLQLRFPNKDGNFSADKHFKK